jgi:hypothetical protein
LTAQRSNSNTVWFNFQTYIIFIIIFVYHLETLIGWKRVTWRSIKSGIARTLLIIVTSMQYINLFLETSVLYTIYQCIFRNIRAVHDLTMYFPKFHHIMIIFKQFDWLSCCHLTFRKIWYCLIKTRIDLVSLLHSLFILM